MISLVSSPLRPAFEEFAQRAQTSCILCAPYISSRPIHRFVAALEHDGRAKTIAVTVVTDVSIRTIVEGTTDVSSLGFLADRVPLTTIRYLPRIHAKVYVADDTYALVTSANFTNGGALGNLEYGVSLRDPAIVRRIAADVAEYAALGGLVTRARLHELETWVSRLRAAVQAERESMSVTLRRVVSELEREAESTLLRARVQGRTVNAVFSDSILYLLSRQPMTTPEVHGRIKELHPDLCDESLDRVIDGEHFGKLWKHQVRNAQQSLKRAGAIANDPRTRLWSLASVR